MINVLPNNQKKMVEKLRIMRVAIVTVWAMIFLVGIAALLLIPLLVTINSRYNIANMQIANLEKRGVVINQVDVVSLEGRTKKLLSKLAIEVLPIPTEYINIIKGASPVGVVLSGFVMQDIKNQTLVVSGTANTREVLQRFIGALQKNSDIKSVNSPVSNFVKSTNTQFTITVTFNK